MSSTQLDFLRVSPIREAVIEVVDLGACVGVWGG